MVWYAIWKASGRLAVRGWRIPARLQSIQPLQQLSSSILLRIQCLWMPSTRQVSYCICLAKLPRHRCTPSWEISAPERSPNVASWAWMESPRRRSTSAGPSPRAAWRHPRREWAALIGRACWPRGRRTFRLRGRYSWRWPWSRWVSPRCWAFRRSGTFWKGHGWGTSACTQKVWRHSSRRSLRSFLSRTGLTNRNGFLPGIPWHNWTYTSHSAPLQEIYRKKIQKDICRFCSKSQA